MKLKNEKKALQMFCEEDAWRDVYKEPFINEADNGRLMAAEGHILIRVEPSLLRCKYKHGEQRMPNYDFERNDINKVIRFADIETAYNKFDLIPEKKSKDGMSDDCPECDGSGEVEYEYVDSEGHTHYKDCDCPICDGTGKRDDYELVETGRMILPKDCTFSMDGQIFDARLLWRIVEAVRLMGFDSITWLSKQFGANIFRVCEGVTVLAMSRLEQGEHHQYVELTPSPHRATRKT